MIENWNLVAYEMTPQTSAQAIATTRPASTAMPTLPRSDWLPKLIIFTLIH